MFSILNIRVGIFLATRQIRRANIWTTTLIVFVMFLTFLNLVVVTGVLVGLVDGINETYRTQYIGDVLVSALDTKNYVERSPEILTFLKTLPQVDRISARYSAGASIESNYKSRVGGVDKPEQIGTTLIGIDPNAEDALTALSSYVVEGSYLASTDFDQVLVGSQLLAKYAFGSIPGQIPLKDVAPGSKIRLTIGGAQREVTVKGIVKSKVDQVAMSVYMPAEEARTLMNRSDYNVTQVAIKLTPQSDPNAFRDLLIRSGIGNDAKVQTFVDSIPSGVADIKNTFSMLGNGISSIGLVVASITIFIVIFINALTRRKFIGILKGIGITGEAIEYSYVFQSLFYAVIGSALGLLILYGFLVPYFGAHPIDFPFSNGILVAPVIPTTFRVILLVLATVVAGFVPAQIIVRKNTLDSILGRN